MQVVVLSARTGWHTDQLCRAFRERGHSSLVLSYESLTARIGRGGRADASALAGGLTSVTAADAVLARIIPDGSLEQIIFRVDALHWLEERGIPVLNSARAIERCVDKFYTTVLLQEAGIPVPRTIVCQSADEAMPAVRALLADGRDVIIKPLFGSMGHGLVRVGDPDLALRVVRPLAQMRAVFYLQEAIDHGGRDYRAFVLGGRVLGAIERRAAPGEWRTNVALGGFAQPVRLPAAWEELAVRATAAVGAVYAGVDLVRAGNGDVFVLEVNAIPAWQGLQRATGIDVAAALADHLTGGRREAVTGAGATATP